MCYINLHFTYLLTKFMQCMRGDAPLPWTLLFLFSNMARVHTCLIIRKHIARHHCDVHHMSPMHHWSMRSTHHGSRSTMHHRVIIHHVSMCSRHHGYILHVVSRHHGITGVSLVTQASMVTDARTVLRHTDPGHLERGQPLRDDIRMRQDVRDQEQTNNLVHLKHGSTKRSSDKVPQNL